MPISRVSSIGISDRNFNFVEQTQRRIQELSIQITSGKKAQSASGIGQDAKRLLDLENHVARNMEYQQTIDTVQRRQHQMELSIETIFDRATTFRQQLLSAANESNSDVMPLLQMAQDFYEEIAGLLNVQQDGRYLFGGSKTDNPPVATFAELEANFRNVLEQPTAGVNDSDHFAAGTVVAQPIAFFDTTSLAEKGAVDSLTGLPIREMQIIDWFTNDATFNSIEKSVAIDGGETPPGAFQSQFGNDLLVTHGGVGQPNVVGTDPVTGASTTRNNTAQAFDFTKLYYKGDGVTLSARVDDDTSVNYGIKANEDGFMRVLAAAAMLALPIGDGTGDPNSPPNAIDLYGPGVDGGTAALDGFDLETKIEAALKLLQDALLETTDNTLTPFKNENNLTDIRGQLGLIGQQLNATDERLRNFNSFFEESIIEIENTDVAQAATMLSQNQLILESSFLSISALSNLTLASFLR